MYTFEKARKRLEEIQAWEERYFQNSRDKLSSKEQLRNETVTYLPFKWQQKAITALDRFLFYAQTTTLNSKVHQETEERMLTIAKVFKEDVSEIADLRMLRLEENQFILSQMLAKQRLLAFGQGGITGLGGPVLLGADLPLLLTVNLRTVQLAAMSFGYDLRKPAEMMLVLHVFRVASTPRNIQYRAWAELGTLQDELFEKFPDFYGGDEQLIDETWLQQPLQQAGKLAMIFILRKKLLQGIPIAGIMLGAYSNYRLTAQVSEVASHFYEKRFLTENINEV